MPRPPAEALVSVVVPCYNNARFLGEAVESALAQTHRNVQTVIVDDGPTDETPQVTSRYPAARYIRQRDCGPSAARNTGLRAAEGDFLVFLDADDLLLPDALAIGLDCQVGHPACAFVSGHYNLIEADGSPIPYTPKPCADEDHYLALLRRNYSGMLAAVMYRRDIFEAVGGFNEPWAACEDYDLYLRIARQHTIRCHHETVSEYRQHGTNTSLDMGLMFGRAVCVLEAQRKYVRGHRPSGEALEAGLSHRREYSGRKFARDLREQERRGECGRVGSSVFTPLRHDPTEFFRKVARGVRARLG